MKLAKDDVGGGRKKGEINVELIRNVQMKKGRRKGKRKHIWKIDEEKDILKLKGKLRSK